LKWLKKAKEETGLLMGTEVANAAHVKLALEYDIDVLWVGARTTVNPFAMQELADALQGTKKIVLVKNPVNPDLSLWLGGVERLYNAGIEIRGNSQSFLLMKKQSTEIFQNGKLLLNYKTDSLIYHY
jgi:chorismate mutase